MDWSQLSITLRSFVRNSACSQRGWLTVRGGAEMVLSGRTLQRSSEGGFVIGTGRVRLPKIHACALQTHTHTRVPAETSCTYIEVFQKSKLQACKQLELYGKLIAPIYHKLC